MTTPILIVELHFKKQHSPGAACACACMNHLDHAYTVKTDNYVMRGASPFLAILPPEWKVTYRQMSTVTLTYVLRVNYS